MKKKVMKKSLLLAVILLFCLSLAGCIPGDGSNSPTDTAGFFSGIWHGWIAPFSLIYSLFNDNISIYEIYNNGFTYNLGFYMAIISGFGGLALSRKKDE
ncbi:hypothetical protein DES36_10587 [Alkalibaculum bacchi]|jgi:hypothetical protein|uniref:Lipoprotein n=1 Tax=Alkalibaculum bacchi TaxID=645887 RepID=A0A366IA07_9FIRM|nr:hypothetical protein [Alkalibaculum bacchi]RBP66706.1 hypothetical protein DES36_10587 [Alkalibaculum bacchi]